MSFGKDLDCAVLLTDVERKFLEVEVDVYGKENKYFWANLVQYSIDDDTVWPVD